MAHGGENGAQSNGSKQPIRVVPLAYINDDNHESALRLVTSIRPDWAEPGSKVEFVRFTDGITNTLLKAVHRRDGVSKEDADREAILLRAYGHGTDVLIDRLRESQNHELLMQHGLAPELLARFQNGMMYRFIRGSVTHPADLRKPAIAAAVARRLAQWHATVPCISGPTGHRRTKSGSLQSVQDGPVELTDKDFQDAIDHAAPGKPSPNVWTVMQKWIFALPTDTESQRTRQAQLQNELESLVRDLSQRPGLGKNGVSQQSGSPHEGTSG
jgi:ethanolamine kinase